MGEIAEMMLDGTMCAGCGEWLNDGEDGDGFPEYCATCLPDYAEEHRDGPAHPATKATRSPGRWLQSISDSTVDKVNEAHKALTGRPLAPATRKRLKTQLWAVLEPHIMPPDGSEAA
jgi:hypothetical protein